MNNRFDVLCAFAHFVLALVFAVLWHLMSDPELFIAPWILWAVYGMGWVSVWNMATHWNRAYANVSL